MLRTTLALHAARSIDRIPIFLQKWMSRKRPLDLVVRSFNEESIDLAMSYKLTCVFISTCVCVPVLILQVMDVVTVSSILVGTGVVTPKIAERFFPQNWMIACVGQLALFIGWIELSNYLTMPFFVFWMAPVWKRRGWFRIKNRTPPPAKRAVQKDKWRK